MNIRHTTITKDTGRKVYDFGFVAFTVLWSLVLTGLLFATDHVGARVHEITGIQKSILVPVALAAWVIVAILLTFMLMKLFGVFTDTVVGFVEE